MTPLMDAGELPAARLMRLSSTVAIVMRARPALQALTFGLLVAILLSVSDQMSMRFGLKESQRIVDDVCGGVIAGLTVFAYARAKMRYITQRLNTIRLMNHHIRNALQVIRYASYIQSTSPHVAEVEDAIRRIDWALREVLPGESTVSDDGWKPAATTSDKVAGARKVAD